MFRCTRAQALGLIALPFLASSALAQPVWLPDLIISANQIPQPADRVGASVSVLNDDEMRARGFVTVTDALRTVPGLHVNAAGSRGNFTQVRIRGTEANHAQVLIDDIPVGRLDGGDFDFAGLLLDDIERIEVVRGPQSGIYGGNAQAGVIAIYTKSGRGLRKPEFIARTEYGSQNTSLLSAGVRGQNGPLYGAVTIQRQDTNSFNISTAGNEKDGSRAFGFNLKAGIDISETFNIEGVLRHTDRKVQYDPEDFGIPLSDIFAQNQFRNTNARINFNSRSPDGALTQRLGLFTRLENLTSICPDPVLCFTNFAQSEAKTHGGDYKISYNFFTGSVAHTSTGLVDWKNETYERVGIATAERQRVGLAYEHITTFAAGLTLSGAIRHDFHDDFSDFTTYRFAASQKLGNSTRLHASYGTGITLPTFPELYGFGLNFPANPNLKPETSKGWDFGIEQTFFNGLFVADITYFSIDATNAITAAFITGAFNTPGVTERRGIEITGKYNPFAWLNLQASYTYLDANTTGGIEEVRRPHSAASFAATFLAPDNKTKASVNVIHNGRMRDTEFQAVFPFGQITRYLTDYTLVNAILTYDVTPNAQLYVRGENLLNEQYQEIYGYRASGATGYVGARVKY